MKRLPKDFVLLGIELFVAVSLSIYLYYLIKPECRPKRYGGQQTGFMFYYLGAHAKAFDSSEQVPPAWRTRLVAPALSAWMVDRRSNTFLDFDSEEFQQVFGMYNAAWVFLTFLALILARRDALLIMLGVFSGLMYYFSDPNVVSYPWDAPSLFFFTAAILLFDQQRLWLLLVVVCLGGLFKETTLCATLLILFSTRWSLSKRLAGVIAVVGIRMLVNKMLMAHYGVHSQLLSMGDATKPSDLFNPVFLFKNIQLLFHPDFRHVFFVNAGALFIVLLIPWRNRRDVALRLVMFLFIIGQFQYGIINEFRIWYEVLPLGWMMLSEFLQARSGMATGTAGIGNEEVGTRDALTPHVAERPAKEEAISAGSGGTPDGTLLKASYWLTLSVAFAAALVGLAVARLREPKSNAARGKNQEEDQAVIRQMSSAAEAGDPGAQYNLGLAYQKAGNYKNAIEWYQQAAEKGHAGAQNNLGVLMASVEHENAKALYWLKQAASVEDADAQFNLGVFYLSGTGIKHDFEQAVEFLQKAALQGHLGAQKNLGRFYRDGTGGKTNKVQAYKWLRMASLQGDKEAENDSKALEPMLTKEEIANAESQVQNDNRIQQLLPVAKAGGLQAQHGLGVAYLIRGDNQNALTWLKRAAERGDAGAENDLGVLLSLTQTDSKAANEWFFRAAEQGDRDAQYNLGCRYQHGNVVTQDQETAAQLFLKAARQGHLKAQTSLGKMYQEGVGVKPDKMESFRWLKTAAIQGDNEAADALRTLAGTMSAEQIAAADKLLLPQPSTNR